MLLIRCLFLFLNFRFIVCQDFDDILDLLPQIDFPPLKGNTINENMTFISIVIEDRYEPIYM